MSPAQGMKLAFQPDVRVLLPPCTASGTILAGVALAALFSIARTSAQTHQDPVSPSPSASPSPAKISLFQADSDLQRLKAAGRIPEAIALAKNILTTFPALDPKTEPSVLNVRYRAIMILKENNGIGGYISELEQRLERSPDDLEAILALAEAHSNTDPARVAAYYEKAARLAPDRIDIALQLASALSHDGHDDEAMTLYDELLRKDLGRALAGARDDLFSLYARKNELPRFAKAIVAGYKPLFDDLPEHVPDLTPVDELARQLIQAGHDEDAINLLTAVVEDPYWSKDFLTRLDNKLIDLLIKHDRKPEAIHEIARLFSPAPFRYRADLTGSKPPRWDFATSLMTWEVPPKSKPNCPAIDLIHKAQAIGGLEDLVAAVRADATKHSEEISEQTLFAMVLVWGRVPEAMSFLPRYFERISGLPPEKSLQLTLQDRNPIQPRSGQNASSETLLAMAQEIRDWPAAKALTFPALAAAQHALVRSGSQPDNYEGLWPDIAQIAMEMDDLPHAQEVLRKLLVIAEQHPKHLRSTEQVLALFEMMLRTKMDREAKAVLEIIRDPKRTRAGFPVTHLCRAARVAMDAGRVDLAKSTAKLLPAAIEKALYDAELNPNEVTASAEILLELNLVHDLEQIISSVRQSRPEDDNFTIVLDGAERLIDIYAGEARGLSPAIFLIPGPKSIPKEMARWDLAVRVTQSRMGNRDKFFITSFEGASTTLKKRHQLEIFSGQSAERLDRIATIKNATRRGSAPVALKADTRFLRGILSDENGSTIIGNPIGVNASPNLVANSSFDGLPALTAMNHRARHIEGWGELPDGDWSFAVAGPLSRSIRYRAKGSKQTIISGERIPVGPGDEFFQSCWVRYLQHDARVRVGRRYLNRDGAELKVSFFEGQDNLGGWSLLQQKLELNRRGQNGEFIPGGCAFIEPIIELRTSNPLPNSLGQLHVWSGMYLGKIVSPPNEKPIDSQATVFFSEKEAPAQIAVSADSRFIAAGYQDGLIRVLDRNGKVIATAPQNSQPIVALRFLREAPQLISFGARGEIRRITLEPTFNCIVVPTAEGEIHNADITPDGACAVIFTRARTEQSSERPGQFEVLDLSTGETVRTIDSGWPGVYNLTVSEDGSRFYAFGNAHLYPPGLWLLASGEKIGFSAEENRVGIDYIKLLGLKHPVSIDVFSSAQNAQAVCADPQRDRSIIARDGKIFVYDRKLKKDVWIFHNAGQVHRLIVIPDTGAILSIGGDSAIRRWTVPASALPK